MLYEPQPNRIDKNLASTWEMIEAIWQLLWPLLAMAALTYLNHGE